MTLFGDHCENGTAAGMNADPARQTCGKPSRPVRNRRCTRRNFVSGQRPPKRLFTPEIKRYLKDWLVRRRDNPYPNRDEKKFLAHETGLTYIQICNWFANWRRKLKNVHADKNQKTWGHLIRTYNDQAQGNVEQFSICSDDSIWSEPEPNVTDTEIVDANTDTDVGPDLDDSPEQSTHTSDSAADQSQTSPQIKYEIFNQLNNNNYSRRIHEDDHDDARGLNNPLLLSKWLESAARFQPSETNYSWWAEGRRRRGDPKGYHHPMVATVTSAPAAEATARHGRDEVEAAVALTALAASTLLHTH